MVMNDDERDCNFREMGDLRIGNQSSFTKKFPGLGPPSLMVYTKPKQVSVPHRNVR